MDAAEANLNKRMLSRAAQHYLLADSSKFGTMATYRVAPLTAAYVITDSGISAQWRNQFADMGVEVTIAESKATPLADRARLS